ncbi:hypothetical protein ES332_A03G213600v1 [Gossypium tomentosum]|uniref:Uncharacterized protein n=1 Tax=Gossypium tomentosum TaxID=34277 RepID=A0A5D2RB24_GOSTO|nr:hypothetical protein ES332_A03G213600v1 [Gossypium tomentosum]
MFAENIKSLLWVLFFFYLWVHLFPCVYQQGFVIRVSWRRYFLLSPHYDAFDNPGVQHLSVPRGGKRKDQSQTRSVSIRPPFHCLIRWLRLHFHDESFFMSVELLCFENFHGDISRCMLIAVLRLYSLFLILYLFFCSDI